jgi:putative transposase
VGVVTDVTEPFKASRTAHRPMPGALAIAFGLSTLRATDEGDLMGRAVLEHLAKRGRRIDNLARHRQRVGLKTRSERYDRLVRQRRGYVAAENTRVLERLVHLKRPEALIVERPEFTHPDLSKRMLGCPSDAKRLLRRCGRAVFRKNARIWKSGSG